MSAIRFFADAADVYFHFLSRMDYLTSAYDIIKSSEPGQFA